MITLYDFRHGARGLRVAWLCEEMGLPHVFVPVAFPPDAAYRALNPFGTVPFLQDGGVAIAESVAMMLHLVEKHRPTELLPVVDAPRAEVLQFTLFGEAALASPMAPLLAARFGAPQEAKRNWSVVGIEARLSATIARLGEEIGDRAFLVGPGLTLADISVVTALGIWRRGLRQELPPKLAAYCARLEGRPAYQAAIAAHA